MSLIYAPEEQPKLSTAEIDADHITNRTYGDRFQVRWPHNRVQPITQLSRRLVLSKLQRLVVGGLCVRDIQGEHQFGSADSSCTSATIEVFNHRFYRQLALGGGLGAAESYIQGDWEAENLTEMIAC
ncbi:MAG: hypothetical protein R3C53_26665 [Pirellulaceae bacterium]